MNKKFFLLTSCLLLTATALSQVGMNINTLTEKGAWCWFADPRALSYENESGTINSTYLGYIDIHGNIKATQINHLTNKTNEVLIRSCFQPDDHDNPTFLVLPDERIIIFYSRHTDERCFYYRISQKPGDITVLGKEMRLETANNTTYPSPFILSDDPNHIYLCWRGIGWHPTIARLTLPDADDIINFDWGPYQIIRSKMGGNGVRPYAKYVSNGKDKIYVAYTTTHPDNQSINYIYLNYMEINTKELKDIRGNRLSTIGESALHDVDATQDYKNSYPYAVVDDTPLRNWLWEVTLDREDKPVIAIVHISDKKDSHDYYYAKWTGSEWQRTFLSNAGGHFHQTPSLELCYSGGMAIDKTNPQVIYGSVPVEGKFGRVYELKKFTVAADGTVASAEQLTFDSPKNNIRPFVISNRQNKFQIAWMYGDYYDWIVSSIRPEGFPTAIRTNMQLPAGKVDLKKGLLMQNSISPDKMKSLRVKKTKTFSIVMTLSIDPEAYYGEILNTNAFVYGLEQSERPKPFINVNNNVYKSANVLGNSDVWKTVNRGTNGNWYAPTKPDTIRLAVTFDKSMMRTYIDGLIDQSVETKGLSLSQISLGGCKGTLHDIRIYNRALSQDEIKEYFSKY